MFRDRCLPIACFLPVSYKTAWNYSTSDMMNLTVSAKNIGTEGMVVSAVLGGETRS